MPTLTGTTPQTEHLFNTVHRHLDDAWRFSAEIGALTNLLLACNGRDLDQDDTLHIANVIRRLNDQLEAVIPHGRGCDRSPTQGAVVTPRNLADELEQSEDRIYQVRGIVTMILKAAELGEGDPEDVAAAASGILALLDGAEKPIDAARRHIQATTGSEGRP